MLDQIIKRKTLIIGIGGTGCAVVGNVIHLLEKKFEREQSELSSAAIQFLAFDTDANERKKDDRSILFKDNIHILNGHKIKEKIKHFYLPENNSYHTWFPDIKSKYIKERDLRSEEGAGQYRAIGRLAYCEDQRKIEAKITKALDYLKGIDNKELGANIDVYLISSLAGGTGSGMLVDIAYFLQLDSYKSISQVQISTYGMLLLPNVFKNSDKGRRIRPNTYAALKELNTFYLTSIDFKMEYAIKGERKFDKGKVTPFSRLFLFNNMLKNRELTEVKDICKYIGKTTYLRIVSEVTDSGLSVTNNIANLDEKDQKDGVTLMENGYVFSAMSGVRIEFPDNNKLKEIFKNQLVKYIHIQTSETVTDILKNQTSYTNLVKTLEKVKSPTIIGKVFFPINAIENKLNEVQESNNSYQQRAKELTINEDNIDWKNLADNSYKLITRCITELKEELIEKMDDLEQHLIHLNYNQCIHAIEQILIILKKEFPGINELSQEEFCENAKVPEKLFISSNIISKRMSGLAKSRILFLRNKRIKENLIELNFKIIERELKRINKSKNKIINDIKKYIKCQLQIDNEIVGKILHLETFKERLEAFDITKILDKEKETKKEEKDLIVNNVYELFEDLIHKEVEEETQDTIKKFWQEIITRIKDNEPVNGSSLLDQVINDVEFQEIKIDKELYTDSIIKELEDSRIIVFSQAESHGYNISDVYLSMPKELPYYFENGEAFKENLRKKLNQTFDEEPQKIETEDNAITIYYETHHHPATNIIGIEDYEREYRTGSTPSKIYHIHYNYVSLPELITPKRIKRDVKCGNPDCDFDISNVPKDIHFCPSCSNPILNRCGNTECIADNLIELSGGFEECIKKERCPKCTNTIKTFKWKCDKPGHGFTYRDPLDKFCPECNKEANKGTLTFEERSIRSDDKIYQLLCPTCIANGEEKPFQIPKPEFFHGTLSSEDNAILNKVLKENNINDNECKVCGSKLFPECPHQDPSMSTKHFLVLDEENRSICVMSDNLHIEEVDFYECYHCKYPITFENNKHMASCPRCKSEVKKCTHCSEKNRYVIDEKTLKNSKNTCPICTYTIS